MKFIIGDTVKITIGKDKGKTGSIKRVLPRVNQVVVENLNLYKRHLKPRAQGGKSGIITKERPLDVAKVSLVCPRCHATTRVGYLVDSTGSKQRLCRKCQSLLKEKK